MADKSKIQWTEATWNPVVGCTKCSPGCKNCYAEKMASDRLRFVSLDYKDVANIEGWTGKVKCLEHRLGQPLSWHKPRKIFVCSMSDLFHPKVPLLFQQKVLNVIEQCPQHTFQILTKRVKEMNLFFGGTSGAGLSAPAIPNLWLGTSISTQAEADEKIPILLQIPAAVRFVSIEPMLEWIDIERYLVRYARHNHAPHKPCTSSCRASDLTKTHWVIVGAESGPNRRTCKIEWIQSIVDQCKAANVPVFVKQIHKDGKLVKMPKEFPQEYPSVNFGAKDGTKSKDI